MIRPLRWLVARFRRRPPPRRNYDILAPERPLTGAERTAAAQRAHQRTVEWLADKRTADGIWGPNILNVPTVPAFPLVDWQGQIQDRRN